ncbi:unnamed protein product, partial [Urochloa humidicola]
GKRCLYEYHRITSSIPSRPATGPLLWGRVPAVLKSWEAAALGGKSSCLGNCYQGEYTNAVVMQ